MDEKIDKPIVEVPKLPAMNEVPPETLPISDADKEQFFKNFLNDTPYEETLFLFNKKFKFKVRSLTNSENADLLRQVAMDKDTGVAENNDAYFIQIATYRLGLALISVNDEDYLPQVTKTNFPEDKAKGITYVLRRAEDLLKWQEFRLSVAIDKHRSFEKKVFELAKKVQDDSFWKAAV